MDFHCIDTGTGNPDVRIQASGGTAGSNFNSYLRSYETSFYFNGNVSVLTNPLTCGTVSSSCAVTIADS